jgi:hypothetical protein
LNQVQLTQKYTDAQELKAFDSDGFTLGTALKQLMQVAELMLLGIG